MQQVLAFIGLGSNLDNPQIQIERAISSIAQLPHTVVVKQSQLYQTKPVGYLLQADFINAVIKIKTKLLPFPLLQYLLKIEKQQLRVRSIKNGPRTIDLDILLYDDCELNEPGLQIPHPRMLHRTFVLKPLKEIAPHLAIFKQTKELINEPT